MKNSRIIFLSLTFVLGLVLLIPSVDFQPLLAQGDHGRDLYAFAQTLSGAQPYQDYWWVYGPLMPYYYALFFKFLGVEATSILTGKIILNLLSGVLFYCTLSVFIAPLAAFLGTWWFWTFMPDFFYTYNNIGGILFMMFATFALFSYIKHPRMSWAWAGLIAAAVVCFIKVNFGLALWAGFLTTVYLTDRSTGQKFTRQRIAWYATAFLFPFLIAGAYAWLVRGLSAMEIRQCLPYLRGDQPYNVSPLVSLKEFWDFTINNIRFTWVNVITAVLLLLCTTHAGLKLFIRKPTTENQQELTHIRLAIFGVTLLLFLNFHEFVLSGVFYRHFWIKPFQYLLAVILVTFAVKDLTAVIKGLLTGVVLLILALHWQANFLDYKHIKTQEHFLNIERLGIFTGNDPSWNETVRSTADFLKNNLRPDELFFAFPYDPLYYYLAGKRTPTRQTIFFEHILIPPEQEDRVIADLEKNRVNWILASSRMSASEHGLGTFGKTYCLRLGKYIDENFVPVAQFGDWFNDPGWAWNHGTRILHRKNPL